MSAFLLLVVAATGGLVIARAVFSDRLDTFVLAGPAILAASWVVVSGLSVGFGLTISDLWLPFWSVTAAASILGGVLIARQPTSMSALTAPTLASLTVMASYVIHGFADFPGSRFWDGFAYMAGGDSLWLFPRGGSIDSPSLFYQFGHMVVRGRFISAALIGLFKGVFPINGDAQTAVGYFLLFGVFTFACSSALLARIVLPDQRRAQTGFVAAATVSGALVNLVWANNFDHLLAFSLSPALLALAFDLNRPAKAITAGLLIAAEIIIYPELCALFVLPAALVALQTALNQPSRRALVAMAISAFVAAVLIAPLWSELFGFFKGQVAGVFNSASAAVRPGDGLFPSFLQWCAPAAAFGFFKPEALCRVSIESLYYMLVCGICIVVLTIGIFKLGKKETALTASCVILTAAIVCFVAKRYDYGAYKVAETAWVPMLAVGAIAFIRSSGTIRRAIPLLAASLVLIGVIRIVAFEQKNKIKTLSDFSALAASLPKDQITAIRLSNPLAFEWASYYLRDHNTVIAAGQLMYFASPAADVEPSLSRLRAASYLVTDRSSPSAERPIWSNTIYAVYKLGGETPDSASNYPTAR